MPIPSRTFTALLVSALAASAGCASTGDAPREGDVMMYGRTYGLAPRLDPDRKISEQDCSKPIVLDGGNLLCK